MTKKEALRFVEQLTQLCNQYPHVAVKSDESHQSPYDYNVHYRTISVSMQISDTLSSFHTKEVDVVD